jgi:hypothetical protein
MWSIDSIHPDPLRETATTTSAAETVRASCILSASAPIDVVFRDEPTIGSLFRETEADRGLRVGLADFCARRFRESNRRTKESNDDSQWTVRLEGLEEVLHATKRRTPNRRSRKPMHPYILERSDFYCSDTSLHIAVRAISTTPSANETNNDDDDDDKTTIARLSETSKTILDMVLALLDPNAKASLLGHLSCVVLQRRLRSELPALGGIAFVGDGSILPRKSGTSDAPMASPPAVPFRAPPGSPMTRTGVTIDMGALAQHLPASLGVQASDDDSSVVSLSGLLVPKGITLICGGGYHGKSTLLQAIAKGHCDTIPGDGRELCVGLEESVVVRAEDGRYVNNCNISAFISNLPTPPGVTKTLDTQHFSTRDSSGSTSQASNVVEALEFGAKTLLVDEDVSAANFMARDGRMRALVMDESITPLLYRVNGLYNTHGISTVVVVGGVGDWLDVPHQVILLDKYVAADATKKAQSISKQFSYGHVQYAGRGVVHRLEWDSSGTPTPRRPRDDVCQRLESNVVVSLLDGGKGLVLYQERDATSVDATVTEDDNCYDDEEDEEGFIDASRVEQLLGKKQLFGAGLCVAWILQNAPTHPHAGLKELLAKLDAKLDEPCGVRRLLEELKHTASSAAAADADASTPTHTPTTLVPFAGSVLRVLESVGYVERPRRFEIAQVLTRMRGIAFEELPVHDDGSEAAARLEEEQRKRALADLWAKRRSRKQALTGSNDS